VRGTPAFFVNGILLRGSRSPEEFFELIDAELVAEPASEGRAEGSAAPPGEARRKRGRR
jgi:hypothetical protein